MNLTIAAVALVTCFIPLAVPKLMKNVISKIKTIEYEELSNFNQYISDRFNGHRVIKIYGAEDYTNNEFQQVNITTGSAIYKSRNLRVLLQVLSMICSYMSYFIVLGMSVFFVAKDILNVGESGSGKSTILKAINDEYGDCKGEVLANNIPIKEYYLVDNLALVDQEPYIFKGSIEENIKLGREIEDEDFFS